MSNDSLDLNLLPRASRISQQQQQHHDISPSSVVITSSSASRSPSIKILHPRPHETESEAARRNQDEAVADYKERAMYERIMGARTTVQQQPQEQQEQSLKVPTLENAVRLHQALESASAENNNNDQDPPLTAGILYPRGGASFFPTRGRRGRCRRGGRNF